MSSAVTRTDGAGPEQWLDALRDAGVPAVISGAGPTVLALASRFALSAVHDVAGGGEVLELSVPTRGITPMSR